jgi:serine/threonine-protein kinase
MTVPRIMRRLSTPAVTPTSLPTDLLEQSCRRVGVASLFFAGAWGMALALHFILVAVGRPHSTYNPGVWPNPGVAVATIGLVLSVAMAAVAGRLHHRPMLLLNTGLAFEILNAALIGFLNQWVPVPNSAGISWICAVVLAYPAIVPSTAGQTMAVAFVSASMDPLWWGVAIGRGVVTQPTVLDAVLLFWPNYLCASAAGVPAHIIRGLSHQVSRAREMGSYRIGKLIGTGGMGEVYLAEHRLLARQAAIKVIRADLIEAVTTRQANVHIERFRREAEAAALLRSPHTIELYDFGFSHDGGFYYVMELLDGLSFEDLVRRFGPVPAERAVFFMLQVCDSLAEAHARGLIHRDIKPSNLFTCRVGLQLDFVKVLDFGLVKAPKTGDVMLTAPNVATGTPAFMAPEVALGESTADARLDVYSMACVLYWLLTGQLVFEGSSAGKLMHRHIQDQPEPPSRRTELPIPPALDELVLACLAKRPDDRPGNAAGLRERLVSLGLADQWTRERAKRWWATNHPEEMQPQPCDQGQVVPVTDRSGR